MATLCNFPLQTLHRFPGTPRQLKAGEQSWDRLSAGSGRLSPWLSEKLPAIRRDGLAPLLTLLSKLSPFTVTDFGKTPPDVQKQQFRADPHRHRPSLSLKAAEWGTKHSFDFLSHRAAALLLLSPRLSCKPPSSSSCYQFDSTLRAQETCSVMKPQWQNSNWQWKKQFLPRVAVQGVC